VRAAKIVKKAVLLIGRNKLMAGITAAFAVAIIAAVVAAGSGPAPAAAKHADPAAPNFTVAVLGAPGQHITLSRQYRDKPVIVNFWASWCDPCQRETPLLARWYKQQHGTVNLIGLDENDSAASALKFAKAKGVTYTLGFDPQIQVANAYGVAGAGIPQTFFLDAQHRVVDHIYGALTTADLTRGLRLMKELPAMRNAGWATRRTPLWIFAVIAVLVAGVAVLSLTQAPSSAQRAGDLRGYFGDVTAGIESCAGGFHDAQTALRKVTGGDAADDGTAVGMLTYNAQNCSPANNEPLQDFTNYQVAESLSSYNLDQADNDVITWAFDAQKAQGAMLTALKAKTPKARAAADTALAQAMAVLDKERATIYAIWHKAQQNTGDASPLPSLPA
jgi:cytochrome c biogenesis protein CcmG, thiol:disulfide interchange protein DsbE